MFSTFNLIFVEIEQTAYTRVNQKLRSTQVIITLPNPYIVQKFNEEESISYIYSFNDSSYVLILEGALTTFPIDGYIPEQIRKINDKIICTGIKNNKYWRKDISGNVEICYDNVSIFKKDIFDTMLDSVVLIKPN